METFASFAKVIISSFNSTVSVIQTLTKKSIRRYLFLGFSTFTELSLVQGQWDEVIRRRTAQKGNELGDAVSSIRAGCLRIFPEVIADIKLAGNLPSGPGGRPTEIGTGLADITKSVADLLLFRFIIILTDFVDYRFLGATYSRSGCCNQCPQNPR
jgi:exocyst complex protein 7